MSHWLARTAFAASLALGAPALAQDILIGIPSSLSGVVGVADHGDWMNGVNMAVEAINGAGGVNGRMLRTEVVDIDLLSPEGTVGAIQALNSRGVHAIASAFIIIPQPAMDAAAVTGVPYPVSYTHLTLPTNREV